MATALSACAALGLRSAYVGAVGTDDNGRRIQQQMRGRGIDLSHVVTRDAANQFAVITVDERTGERIVLWDRDDRLMLRPDEVPAALIASARLIHVDDVDEEAAIRAATLARAAGVPATSDLDRVTERTPELVAAVSIPIFAEHMLRRSRARPTMNAPSTSCARRTPAFCASRSARALDVAGRRRTLLRTGSRWTPSTPPGPAMCSAQDSSTRCSTGNRRTISCASRTPRLR